MLSNKMHVITNLQDLLQDYLGDRQIITYKTSNLTSAGENYGSLMLKVDLKVKNRKTGEEESIFGVCKTPPPSAAMRKLFNTQVSFVNEIAFYKDIFPLLRGYQEKHDMEAMSYFPDFLGGRLNLKGGDLVDDEAALVLENLVINGFECESRYKGFDLETTKMIVKDLANFHATAIAFKLEKPAEFNSKIRPHLDGVQFSRDPEDMAINMILSNLTPVFENERIKDLKDKTFDMMKHEDECLVKEPWATISHNDLWVNNTMVKFEEGKPVKNKFVDFQVCRYHSAASDLLFLLLISTQDEVLTEHFDFLLEYYHKEFITTLEALDVDVTEFSWESFEKELLYAKNDQIRHCLVMMFPIFMEKHKAVEAKDMGDNPPHPFGEPSPRHIEKLIVFLELLEKKGWLN